MGKRRRALGRAVFLAPAVLAAGLAGCAARTATPGPPPYRVQVGTVVQQVYLAGSVSAPLASVSYAGPLTTLTSVLVRTGQAVAAGAPLARLANGLSLVAPLSGTVVNIGVNPGEVLPQAAVPTTVSAGGVSAPATGFQAVGSAVVSPVPLPLSITVADIARLYVAAAADEESVLRLKSGEAATLVLPGEPGILYSGRVASVAEAATTAAGGTPVYPVIIALDLRPGQPTPDLGMSCQISVTVRRERGLAVPIAALKPMGGGWAVQLADGRRTPVTLGIVGLDRAIVRTGLRAGERLDASGMPNRHANAVSVAPGQGYSWAGNN